jgi:hypothetical protein
MEFWSCSRRCLVKNGFQPVAQGSMSCVGGSPIDCVHLLSVLLDGHSQCTDENNPETSDFHLLYPCIRSYHWLFAVLACQGREDAHGEHGVDSDIRSRGGTAVPSVGSIVHFDFLAQS